MFRQIYKEVNNEINGDKRIIEKAFARAEKPEEKKANNIFKYSFVGTAAAAVIIIGAVFANPDIFVNKSDGWGQFQDGIKDVLTEQKHESATEYNDKEDTDVKTDEEVVFYERAAQNSDKIKRDNIGESDAGSTPQASNGEADLDNDVFNEESGEARNGEENKENQDYGVMSASYAAGNVEMNDLEDETEDLTYGKEFKGRAAWTAADCDEYTNGDESETDPDEMQTIDGIDCDTKKSDYEAFSYIYDKDMYTGCDNVITEGFVNTEKQPVSDADEAKVRAAAECTIGYTDVKVARDLAEGIWRVTFYDGVLEKTVTVYTDDMGITRMIVWE